MRPFITLVRTIPLQRALSTTPKYILSAANLLSKADPYRRLKMKIEPIQVSWSDNWMYLITDEASQDGAIVDPWDAEGAAKAVKAAGVNVSRYPPPNGRVLTGVQVTSIITTHHHNDHSGGNDKFVKMYPGIKVYGGSKKGQGVDHIVNDGDTFKIGENIDVK
jgi:hydroxyacylglutathione hydrolase